MAKLTIEKVSDIANKMGFILQKGVFQTAGGHKGPEKRIGYMLINGNNNGVVCGAEHGFAYNASLKEVADFLKQYDPETFNEN